eukprot:COSAG05_NODE_3249_length_2208_cov_9.455570_1_plen_73_part_10
MATTVGALALSLSLSLSLSFCFHFLLCLLSVLMCSGVPTLDNILSHYNHCRTCSSVMDEDPELEEIRRMVTAQ